MYITINDVKGEKRIDLSYSIHSNKEIAVIIMLSDNIQYKVLKLRSVMDSDSKKLIPSGTMQAENYFPCQKEWLNLTNF